LSYVNIDRHEAAISTHGHREYPAPPTRATDDGEEDERGRLYCGAFFSAHFFDEKKSG